MAFGCSSDINTDDESDGGAGGSASTEAGPGVTVSVGVGVGGSGVGGGSQGDGNDSFEEAQDVTIGMQFSGSLDPETDYDYYKFSSPLAGQALYISTDAKPNDTPFADGYADLVISLYDSEQNKIAENDDPIPRDTQDSELFTVLPAAGDYYLRVGDFCHWSETEQSTPCPTPQVIDFPQYGVRIDPVTTENFPSFTSEEDGDTALNYAPASPGYYAALVLGTSDDASEVDTYTFTVPADVEVTQGRSTARFDMFPAGPLGNGSSAATGKIWVTLAGSTDKIAEIDATMADPTFGLTLNMPATFGTVDYEVHHQAADGFSDTNPFHYFFHSFGGSNDVEADEAGNNMKTGAESFAPGMSTGGSDGFFVAGDFLDTDDVDWFELDLTGNGITADSTYTIGGACSATRIGSGATVQFSVEQDDGTVVHSATETAAESANFGDDGKPFPSGTVDSLFLKVETTAQSADVSGAYYQCGVVFIAPES